MAGGIPSEAIGVSVAVLLYSTTSFTACMLTICLLFKYGETLTFMTMLASFTALSTFASIIQQFYYAFNWRAIKQADFEKAVKSIAMPSLAFSGPADTFEIYLFNIQYYSYQVMGLCVLFWAFGLFVSAWQIGGTRLGTWQLRGPVGSKIFAVVWPGIVIGLANVQAIQNNTVAYFMIANITLLLTPLLGSILLVLILYKYMKTRRIVAGSHRRGGWWASKESGSNNSVSLESGIHSSSGQSRRSIYDRALVTRFTIGFVILAIFEGTTVAFNVFSSNSYKGIAIAGSPDFSVHGCISDILFFVPGVTASLVIYLVFGTAKPWRQYRELIGGCCGLRKNVQRHRKTPPDLNSSNADGIEFQRLPSIANPGPDIKGLQGKTRILSMDSLPTSTYNPTIYIPITQNPNKPLPETPQTPTTPITLAESSMAGNVQYFHKPLFLETATPADRRANGPTSSNPVGSGSHSGDFPSVSNPF